MEVRPDDPTLEVAEDVCFVPDRLGGGWGVFDAEDQPLAASLDYNLPWSEPMWPKPVSPVRWGEVERTLPDGEYLYLGFIHRHFGHFLLDTLSRAWPLLEQGLAGRKLLFHGRDHPDIWRSEAPWLMELISGMGLSGSDFLHLTEPVRVKRLQMPGRSFQGQTFAHQVHQRLCRKIGTSLLGEAGVSKGGAPVYLSKARLKGPGVRKVVNEHQLEAFLRPRGVEILYPETLTVRDQIGLFASGRTVSGTLTSGFHLSLFAPPEGRIVGVETQGDVNSNFFIIDELNGNTATYLQALGSRREGRSPDGFMFQDSFRDPVAVGRELLHFL